MIKPYRYMIIGVLMLGCSSGSSQGPDVQETTPEEGLQEEDTQGNLEIQRLLDKGKEALESRAFARAEEYFEEVLSLDGANTTAKFGLVLADVQRWVGFLDAFLSAYAPTPEVFEEGGRAEPSGKDISAMLVRYFNAFILSEERVIGLLMECIEDPDFEFEIDHFPIHMEGKVRVDLGGTWTKADALWLLSMEYGLKGIFDILLSNGWGKDGGRLYDALNKGLGFGKFASSLYTVLATDPGFWTHEPEHYDAFLEDLKNWANYGLQAVQETKKLNFKGKGIFKVKEDKGKTLVLIQGNSDEKDALVFLFEGKKFSLKKAYQLTLDAVDGKGLWPLGKGLLVPLLIGLDVVRQVVPLDAVLKAFGLDLGQYSGLVKMVANAKRDGESFINIVYSGLPMLLFDPDALAFDLKAGKEKGFGLRDLLPAVPKAGVLPYDGPWMEYDCIRIAIASRGFAFDQPLKVVLFDLKGQGSDKNVKVSVLSHALEITDSEAITLHEVPGVPGLFYGSIPTRLTASPASSNGIVEGSKDDSLEVYYELPGMDAEAVVEITGGVPASYAGNADPCSVEPSEALSHFEGDSYSEVVQGLPYPPVDKPDTRPFRLWPGAEKGIFYINPKRIGISNQDEFVKADSRLFDQLARGILKK